MTKAGELYALAERCEQATGPDSRLDVQIEIATNPTKPWIIGDKPGPWPRDPVYGTLSDLWTWATDESKEPPEIAAAKFTASLDAAMTLMPEGWEFVRLERERTFPGVERQWSFWAVMIEPGGFGHVKAEAASPALALCAAALKAHAASADTHPKGGDVEQAPFMGSAVGNAETPNLSHSEGE